MFYEYKKILITLKFLNWEALNCVEVSELYRALKGQKNQNEWTK